MLELQSDRIFTTLMTVMPNSSTLCWYIFYIHFLSSAYVRAIIDKHNWSVLRHSLVLMAKKTQEHTDLSLVSRSVLGTRSSLECIMLQRQQLYENTRKVSFRKDSISHTSNRKKMCFLGTESHLSKKLPEGEMFFVPFVLFLKCLSKWLSSKVLILREWPLAEWDTFQIPFRGIWKKPLFKNLSLNLLWLKIL